MEPVGSSDSLVESVLPIRFRFNLFRSQLIQPNRNRDRLTVELLPFDVRIDWTSQFNPIFKAMLIQVSVFGQVLY